MYESCDSVHTIKKIGGCHGKKENYEGTRFYIKRNGCRFVYGGTEVFLGRG